MRFNELGECGTRNANHVECGKAVWMIHIKKYWFALDKE